MHKTSGSIPINNFGGDTDTGIVVEKISITNLPDPEQWNQPERHDRHSFFLIEKGAVTLEIDFRKYKIGKGYFTYMHPSQVHRLMALKNVTLYSFAINNENLNASYVQWLEDITPAKPLRLNKATYSLFAETISLCIKYAERQQDKLYHSLLKDCGNAIAGLAIAQYLEHAKGSTYIGRQDAITKAFREALEHSFTYVKRPAEYARMQNISAQYLNECVKNATGHPVSYHIHQRITLEAKRLLHHSGKSVKEIAAELGYDDHTYFSRLFTKHSGMTALAFRTKNRN